MKLSYGERWILANQYRILEALDKTDYSVAKKVLENGYEILYEEISPIINEREVLGEEEGREVLDILSMFRCIKVSFDRLMDKEGVDETYLVFGGFDGNDETGQFALAKFFCLDMDRFEEFREVDFNSHLRMLPKYRRMLSEFKQAGYNFPLDKDQIIKITSA